MSETSPNHEQPGRAAHEHGAEDLRTLSAPELCLLRGGGRGDGAEALRMAILELIARGILRMDSRDATRRYLAVRRTGLDVDLDPPLAAVAASIGHSPVSVRALEHELSLTWATPKDYLWAEVVPALCGRGLARVVDRRRPLRWLGPKLELTERGSETRARLDERLGALAVELGGWLSDDPRRAAACIEQAGAALLLERSAWPHARKLLQRVAPPAGATTVAAMGGQAAIGFAELGTDLDLSILDGRAAHVLDGSAGGGRIVGGGVVGDGGGGCGDGGGGGGGC